MKWTRMGFLRCTAVFAMALSVSVSWRQPSAAVETEPVTGGSTEAAKEVKAQAEETLPSETLPASGSEASSEKGPSSSDQTDGAQEPEHPSEGENGNPPQAGNSSESGTQETSPSGWEQEFSSESEQTTESGIQESSSESESASESETQESSSEGGESPESETQKPQWPQGQYLVRITDAAVKLPDDGRIYDGTDRIEIIFRTQIDRIREEKESADGGEEDSAPDEEVPSYQVSCSAHLEGADAGEQKVMCSFSLQTSYPEHVKLDEATIHPDLKVIVQKAVLRVTIPDGTKRYGDPADLKHIRFREDPAVKVSGFVLDASGNEIIPSGFEPPEIMVDKEILNQWSPVYDKARGASAGTQKAREYAHALCLKKDAKGKVTGNPTENYVFCSDPKDTRLRGGTVTIERAPALRNTTYELLGEKGAYRIDSDGTVIVRSGTSLSAIPLSGQGYNTGAKFTDITSDSTFTFRLEQRNSDGSLAADSETETIFCRVDGSAPEADIKVSGAFSSGGSLFSSSTAYAAIKVPEDTVSGLSRIRYRILSGTLNTDTVGAFLQGTPKLSSMSEWRTAGQDTDVLLSGQGIYAVEAEVTDQVGNTSLTQSQTVAIDDSIPDLKIAGVENGSANASAVRIHIYCKDPSYLPGSLKAEMKADFGGMIPDYTLSEDSPEEAVLSFADFPRQKDADAVYHLSVTASDRAGNHARKQISFSVNRYGSSYSLAVQTAQNLKKFYHIKPFDVTFLETNLDQVGDARVLLRTAGKLEELRPGAGIETEEKKDGKGVSRYSYTVPASRFLKDGTYEVMLLTTDSAGNSSDSIAQRLPVRFAIDTAAPECLVSGIRPEGRYKEKKMTAVVEVRDNQALDKTEVYVDTEKASGVRREQSSDAGEILKIPLSEKKAWQTVQVYAGDKAGNERWTSEIPVYISSDDPESAQAYRRERLSAQQMEMLRKSLNNFWKRLTGNGLLHRKNAKAASGTVKNLYRASLREERRDAPSGEQTVQVIEGAYTGSRRAGTGWGVMAGIALTAAALGLSGGVFWYRKRRVSGRRTHLR